MIYKCGHKTNGIIILDENLISLTAYIQWAEEEGNLETQNECFDCYLKKLNSSKTKKEYKCLICKEEINENEMCKCMKEYLHNHRGAK